MVEPANPKHLEQAAADLILEAAGLTDELTDEEARPLVAWGLSQAEAAARTMAASPPTATTAGSDMTTALAERLTPVRRTMKAVNGLVAERYQVPAEEFQQALHHLLDLAARLPRPPAQVGIDAPLPEWTAHPTELDNTAFVRAVLALLAAGPEPLAGVPTGPSEAGDKRDREEANDDDRRQPGPPDGGDPVRPAPSGPLPAAGQEDRRVHPV